MNTIAISEFKARALKIIENIAKTRHPLIITKRGKPIAEIIPFRDDVSKPKPGKLASALVFEKDIVSPLDKEMWEVCR
jgi:prevent-host-death family protein